MKSSIITLMLIILAPCAFCQAKIDFALQKKIMDMFKEDQKWRRASVDLENGRQTPYDEPTINKNMGITDSLNLLQAKVIIGKYGFPGYSLVGEDGSDNFWAIIQHCDDNLAFQQQALLLMAKEVKKHNASGEKFALLQDRILVGQGRKQLYGSQVRVDLKTHHAKPFPIQDSLKVDARRKAVGLQPLKDYLKLFDKH